MDENGRFEKKFSGFENKFCEKKITFYLCTPNQTEGGKKAKHLK